MKKQKALRNSENPNNFDTLQFPIKREREKGMTERREKRKSREKGKSRKSSKSPRSQTALPPIENTSKTRDI